MSFLQQKFLIMSKINLFYFLCLITLTFSCGGDDESTPMNANDDLLVGTWNLVSLDYSGVSTTTDPYGETISSSFEGQGKDITATVEFKENMEYLSSGSYTVTLVQEVYGYEIEQDVPISNFLGFGTWEKEGDIVRTMAEGSTEAGESTIVELTESSLKFEFTQVQNQETQGYNINQSITGMYSLTR